MPNEVKVRLVTEADQTGIQQTEAGLAKLKAEAGAASGPSVTASAAGIAETASAAANAITGAAVGLGVIAGVHELVSVLREASEESARLNKEIADQSNNLDKAAAKWREIARSAETSSDVQKIADKAIPELDKIIQKNRELYVEQTTAAQSLIELSFRLFDPLARYRGAFQPFTEALTQAQEEMRKLAAVAEETALANIRAAQQSEAAWEAVKLEPISQSVTELTAKLEAYKKAQAEATDIKDFEFFGERIKDTEGKLKSLTNAQDRLGDASKRVTDELKKIDFDKLSEPEQLDNLKTQIDDIQQSLRELGINAETAGDAVKQAANLSPDAAKEALKLAHAWAEVANQISRTAKAVATEAKASADQSAKGLAKDLQTPKDKFLEGQQQAADQHQTERMALEQKRREAVATGYTDRAKAIEDQLLHDTFSRDLEKERLQR
jgi:chromosome segregation ATPase